MKNNRIFNTHDNSIYILIFQNLYPCKNMIYIYFVFVNSQYIIDYKYRNLIIGIFLKI